MEATVYLDRDGFIVKIKSYENNKLDKNKLEAFKSEEKKACDSNEFVYDENDENNTITLSDIIRKLEVCELNFERALAYNITYKDAVNIFYNTLDTIKTKIKSK